MALVTTVSIIGCRYQVLQTVVPGSWLPGLRLSYESAAQLALRGTVLNTRKRVPLVYTRGWEQHCEQLLPQVLDPVCLKSVLATKLYHAHHGNYR